MKKLFLILFLFYAITSFCQPGDPVSAKERRQKERDSIISFYKKKRDSLTNSLLLSDTDLIKQNRETSTSYFVRLQKENRLKEKKAAIARIAIGAVLLVILIIGLKRRRKKQGEGFT